MAAVSGLHTVAESSADKWVVLAYLSDAPTLAKPARGYLDKIRQATGRGDHLAIAQWGRHRYRLSYGRSEEVEHACPERPVDALADLVRSGVLLADGRPLALIILGHGTPVESVAGPFEEAVADPGIVIADKADGLDPPALASAVAAGLGPSHRSLDLLALDVCYGASVETVSALSGVTRTFIGSSDLYYSPGLPWNKALGRVAESTGDAGEVLARGAVEAMAQTPTTPPTALVALREASVGRVVRALNELAEALGQASKEHSCVVTFARGATASWGGNRELCDVAGLCDALVRLSPDANVRAAAAKVSKCCKEAVIATARGGSGSAALAVFFPPPLHRLSDRYVDTATSAGLGAWARYVKSYLDETRRIVQPPQ